MAGNVYATGVERLNQIDKQVLETLDMIIDAAGASLNGQSDVTFTAAQLDGMTNEELEQNGFIHSGGDTGGTNADGTDGTKRMEANIAGTGGVALIEWIKQVQATTTSNITNVMSQWTQLQKIAERNIKGS